MEVSNVHCYPVAFILLFSLAWRQPSFFLFKGIFPIDQESLIRSQIIDMEKGVVL